MTHGVHASGVRVTGIDVSVRLHGLRAHGRHRRARQRPRPRGMIKTLVTVTCAAFFVFMPDPGWAGHAQTATGHAPAAGLAHRTPPGYARLLGGVGVRP